MSSFFMSGDFKTATIEEQSGSPIEALKGK